MKTGLKIMEAMTRHPISVSPSDSALKAAALMKKEHVGNLLVENKGKLVGIVTEQDLVYKIVAESSDPKKVTVKDIMSTDVITIEPDKDITEAMLKMGRLNVRRLPVTEDGRIIGMLTLKDVLKIEPQLFELIVDKIELREEKNKPIYRIGEREGLCELCGEYSPFLFEQDGVMVCAECRDT